jgi:hypothetical protein
LAISLPRCALKATIGQWDAKTGHYKDPLKLVKWMWTHLLLLRMANERHGTTTLFAA